MDTGPLYIFDPQLNQARGPYPIQQLKDFAETGFVTPKTLVAPANAPTWTVVQDWPELRAWLFPDQHLHLRVGGFQATPEAPSDFETDPSKLLAENRAHEDPDKIIITDEDMLWGGMSKRTRDYLIAVIGGNLAAIILTFVIGINPVSLLYLLSFATIWTAGLTWIMCFVIDRY